MSLIKFNAVVPFEISEADAVSILAAGDEYQQSRSMADWLRTHLPSPEGHEVYNCGCMKEALGKHLAEVKVSEARQLTLNAESVPLTEP